MSRTKWTTYQQTGSGGSWEPDGNFLYVANENQERSKTGTLIQTKLASGAYAYSSPETKYNWEPITFTFLSIDDSIADDATFIDTLNDYIDNAIFVKIVDNDGGEMIGIFTALNEVWISGVANSKDYMATFARME